MSQENIKSLPTAKVKRRLNAQKYTLHNYTDKFLLSSDDFPTNPVAPDLLVSEVKKKLNDFNIIISHNTPQLISELCKSFNQSIYLNQNNLPYQNLVLSPQTGSAKSLSAQVYVSLLKNESSVIVVQRVDTAIDFCTRINEWSGEENYARCLYQISKDNSNHTLRVDKENLKDYRCIVITHNMFIRVNKSNEINRYKQYNQKNRDFTLIDERINLHDKYTIHKKTLQAYLELSHMIAISQYNENDEILTTLMSIEIQLNEVLETFDSLKTIVKKNNLNIAYSNYHCESSLVPLRMKEVAFILEDWQKIIKDNEIKFTYISIMAKESHAFNKQAKAKLLSLLDSIIKIGHNDFFYYKDGNDESITSVIPIKNQFGSCVTLDATAKINAFYNFSIAEPNNPIKLIKTTQSKIYSNLTIHTAEGFFQGKSTIYKSKSGRKEAKQYLELIESTLSDNNDKILIITSKDFRQKLESLTANKRISFTHWGNHIGKNEWNDCARVMVIGWNFYRNVEYYAIFLSVYNSLENAFVSHMDEKRVRHKVKVTQLADDLIQAVNRSSIRNIVDENGNCPKSHIYIFYGNKEEYDDVMDIFLDHFEGADIQKWFPEIGKNLKSEKSGPHKRIDAITATISKQLQKSESVLLTTIIIETKTPKSTMSRLMQDDYFTESLTATLCKRNDVDDKSIAFTKLGLLI